MSVKTLLDIFVPPEGMVGHSAVLVAMTATEEFLEDAVQRFTGLGSRQRAELGNVLLYLMLDGHASAARSQVFSPGRIPGLHEFQPRTVDPRSLLHAKMALFGFAASRTGAPIHLRFAVLTANFTYSSARRQLELVWTVDVPLDGTARAENRADIAAGAKFVDALLERRFYRDEQRVPAKQRKLTARLDTLLLAASELAPSNRKPRFIHSLDHTLYQQIRERFRNAIDSPRNLLLCGSGSFEEPSRIPRKPIVLGRLEKLGVFTANVRRIVLVEPGEAGAVGNWAKRGRTDGWEVVRPMDALGLNRRLHAKFVYTGYIRDGRLSNGWIYLGSGNLSRRGLLTNGTMRKGNVETGVVFAVSERLDEEASAASLFWSEATHAITEEEWKIGQVSDAPEGRQLLEVPPILSASIEQAPQVRLRCHWREDAPDDVHVQIQWMGREWTDARRGMDIVLRENDAPTALHVRMDGASREWLVPVIDAGGRLCWVPPRFGTFADALAALLDFPTRPAEATDDEDNDDGAGGGGGTGKKGTDEAVERDKSYALHAAAQLIENVAALQLSLPQSMLDDWLDHLDRMFRASFPEHLVATWREHGLDVFAHLREPELRSLQLSDKQRARYFEVLDAAAKAWRLR